jgi:butyryl-CoA dehydrogenase
MDTTMNQDDGADELGMLRDAALRWVEREGGFEARRAALACPEGFSTERWRAFADMGWLALGLPDDCGGIGDARHAAIVADALGRANAVEPWLANVGLAAPLLAALRATPDAPADRETCDTLLAGIAAGECRVALAAWEPQGRHDASDVTTRAERVAAGWRLTGVKTLVFGGGAVDTLLVLARVHGTAREADGLSVFEVPVDAPGLARRALPTYDGRQAADLRLDGVVVPAGARLGAAGGAWPAVEAAIDHATALACVEAVGTMQAVLDTTRAYLQQRRQFGRPLAANQVLRHRLVDLLVSIEQSRAISLAAVERLGDAPALRRRAVSLAKAFVSPAARACGEEGIQLHGAVGMTEETAIGHMATRLVGFANFLGDEAWHLERLAPRIG